MKLCVHVYVTMHLLSILSLYSDTWFVEKATIQAVLNGVLIEKKLCRTEKVSIAVLDENVDIHLTHSYFFRDAWIIHCSIECAIAEKRVPKLDVYCMST